MQGTAELKGVYSRQVDEGSNERLKRSGYCGMVFKVGWVPAHGPSAEVGRSHGGAVPHEIEPKWTRRFHGVKRLWAC